MNNPNNPNGSPNRGNSRRTPNGQASNPNNPNSSPNRGNSPRTRTQNRDVGQRVLSVEQRLRNFDKETEETVQQQKDDLKRLKEAYKIAKKNNKARRKSYRERRKFERDIIEATARAEEAQRQVREAYRRLEEYDEAVEQARQAAEQQGRERRTGREQRRGAGSSAERRAEAGRRAERKAEVFRKVGLGVGVAALIGGLMFGAKAGQNYQAKQRAEYQARWGTGVEAHVQEEDEDSDDGWQEISVVDEAEDSGEGELVDMVPVGTLSENADGLVQLEQWEDGGWTTVEGDGESEMPVFGKVSEDQAEALAEAYSSAIDINDPVDLTSDWWSNFEDDDDDF